MFGRNLDARYESHARVSVPVARGTVSGEMEMTLPFQVRHVNGRVQIRYSGNDDPLRWGYHLLGLEFDIDVARGFPVIEARVDYPAEGYAAVMSWIQVARYWVGPQEEPTVVVDVAPQMRAARMPYISFGIRPTLFDAPAFTEQNVVWRAWSFLTYTPDALMTPVVEPACGFRWGYDVREHAPQPTELVPASRDEWLGIRTELTGRYPEWSFKGDDWEPPPWPARAPLSP